MEKIHNSRSEFVVVGFFFFVFSTFVSVPFFSSLSSSFEDWMNLDGYFGIFFFAPKMCTQPHSSAIESKIYDMTLILLQAKQTCANGIGFESGEFLFYNFKTVVIHSFHIQLHKMHPVSNAKRSQINFNTRFVGHCEYKNFDYATVHHRIDDSNTKIQRRKTFIRSVLFSDPFHFGTFLEFCCEWTQRAQCTVQTYLSNTSLTITSSVSSPGWRSAWQHKHNFKFIDFLLSTFISNENSFN